MKMNINFTFKPVKNNVYSRHGEAIKYIVVHDTGNSNRGAGAMAHFNYVNTNSRGASAHYFVDDKGIVQFVGDSRSAGAVGDGKGRFGITNRNSISVEMCINSDGDYNKTYFTTVELVKNLMVKFKVPADRVVRHYDASRKFCPNHMRIDNWAKWWKFKKDIKRPMVVKIDLSKDSVNKPLDNGDKENDIMDNNKPSKWAEKEWEEGTKLGITDGSNPKKPATREEVVAMIVRAMKK